MDVELFDGESDVIDAVSVCLWDAGMEVVLQEVGDALHALRKAGW